MPYYPPFSTLSEEELNKFAKDMKELEQFFRDKFNLSLYLVYGTLLGAIRNQDFIPHDVDVDLAYLSILTNREDVLKERIKLREKLDSYHLMRNLYTVGLKLKFNNNIKFVKYNLKMISLI